MKIKSIKKLDKYGEVELGDIKDDWYLHRVLTPTGFVPIRNFFLVKSGAETVKLKFSNGMDLECDPKHILQVFDSSGAKVDRFVCDLSPGDNLVGYGDKPVSFEVAGYGINDLYDITIDNPHWYYTSGVVSHNSLTLVNSAIHNVIRGHNVLYITLEMSEVKSALRAMGVVTGMPIDKSRFDAQDSMLKIIKNYKASGAGDFALYEFPSDTISVDHVKALLDDLKRSKAWIPKLIIVDYLELMVSKRESDNGNGDYSKQKAVSVQLRGLALSENTTIYTATQTNRSGNDGEIIDVTKMAESYGKAMPMDYLVSINQTEEEYMQHPAPARLYVAKNRNGPKFITVDVKINYKTMIIKEASQ